VDRLSDKVVPKLTAAIGDEMDSHSVTNREGVTMRKPTRPTKRRKPRRFFPGSNLALEDIELPELEDWM
jgi:hypothetical protein